MTGRQTDLGSWVSQRLCRTLRQGLGVTQPIKISVVCGGLVALQCDLDALQAPLQVCEALTHKPQGGQRVLSSVSAGESGARQLLSPLWHATGHRVPPVPAGLTTRSQILS